ncbi:hypothetical protein AB0H00_31600 [Nocardia sp. NPDC023852]|uniref:hypothetical protein n=1 Tax=Nocardia sp. NPDC023852 TaxID=3154697 RepID=UPI0033E50C7D
MPRDWDAPTLWTAEDLLKSLWDNVDHPRKRPGLRAENLDFSYGAGTVLRTPHGGVPAARFTTPATAESSTA